MAAVLAAGDGAVLSYRSAAALWGVRDTGRARIEVSVPRHRRSTARVELHEVELPHDEVTIERGIPVTTPARTLFDLAAVVSEQEVEHAFNQAEFRRLGSPTSLDALLTRYPRRRGIQAIRRVSDNHAKNGATVTRSLLERRFLALIDAHRLPRPVINRTGPEGELDARWPDQRLVVECDGFAAHGTRDAFERDRARDRAHRRRLARRPDHVVPAHGRRRCDRAAARPAARRWRSRRTLTTPWVANVRHDRDAGEARPNAGASTGPTAGTRRGSRRRGRAGGGASRRQSRWWRRGLR